MGQVAFSPMFSQKNKGLYFLDIDPEIAYKLLHLSIKRAKLVVRFSIAWLVKTVWKLTES